MSVTVDHVSASFSSDKLGIDTDVCSDAANQHPTQTHRQDIAETKITCEFCLYNEHVMCTERLLTHALYIPALNYLQQGV